MKKIIGLILILCLLFSFTADAFAAGKPKITKQPVNGIVKKGKVSFQVKVTGSVDSISWYLVNPDTGEAITAKRMKKEKTVPKLVISGENSRKLSLSKVPEGMHGWSVYCHISGNGYKLDSDTVLILIDGMEAPEANNQAPAEDTPPADENPPAEDNPPAEESLPAEDTTPAEESQPAEDITSAEENQPAADVPPADSEAEPESKTFKVSSSARVLYRLDISGKTADDKPASSLEFDGPGSFIVRSDDPISSWSVNGIRFEPAAPVYEFKVTNVTKKLSLDFDIQHKSASSAVVDESKMCKVSCEGCTFTCITRQLYSVNEGEVPSGSMITIIAGDSSLTKNGYTINGGNPDYLNLSTFSFTVEEDVTIVLK